MSRWCPECGQRLRRRNLTDDPTRVRSRAERILAVLPKESVTVTRRRLVTLERESRGWTSLPQAPDRPDYAARLLPGVTRTPKEPKP